MENKRIEVMKRNRFHDEYIAAHALRSAYCTAQAIGSGKGMQQAVNLMGQLIGCIAGKGPEYLEGYLLYQKAKDAEIREGRCRIW